eukprot:6186193-Pleurochrysis_carterae.AAC.1
MLAVKRKVMREQVTAICMMVNVIEASTYALTCHDRGLRSRMLMVALAASTLCRCDLGRGGSSTLATRRRTRQRAAEATNVMRGRARSSGAGMARLSPKQKRVSRD